jgi:hypothetical protein
MKKKMVNREKRIWEKRKKKKEKQRKRNERVWERVVGANCNMFKSTSVQLSTVPLPLFLSWWGICTPTLSPSLLSSLSLLPSIHPICRSKTKKMFGGRLFFCSSPPTQHWQKKCFLSFFFFFSFSVSECVSLCNVILWQSVSKLVLKDQW